MSWYTAGEIVWLLWPDRWIDGTGFGRATTGATDPASGSGTGAIPIVRLATVPWPVVRTPPTTPTSGAVMLPLPVTVTAADADESTSNGAPWTVTEPLPVSVSELPDGASTHRPHVAPVAAAPAEAVSATGVVSVTTA